MVLLYTLTLAEFGHTNGGTRECICTLECSPFCTVKPVLRDHGSGLSGQVSLYFQLQWSLRFKTSPFNNYLHFKTEQLVTQFLYFQHKYPFILRQPPI